MDIMETLGILGQLDDLVAVDLQARMISTGVPDATIDQIGPLWTAYQDAVLEKKLPAFLQDAKWAPTLEDVATTTQLPKMTVAAFLTALRAQAKDWSDTQYLDPGRGQALRDDAVQKAKDILAIPGKVAVAVTKPVTDAAVTTANAVSGPLMWVAIAAAAMAAIYVTFQVAPMFAGVKVSRKRKG
jgi:hypothetical protein